MSQKIRIGLVGLGFGINYLRAYVRHPDVKYVGLCDISEQTLQEVGQQYGITRLYRNLDEMITSNEFDAIHVMTQIPDHAAQTVQVLDADLHCACTLPMGVSLDELAAIAASVKRNRKRYMLMEPNAYLPITLYLRELYRNGEMGRIQFMRGIQTYFLNNTTNAYWRGMPPMYYISHALAPLLTITGARCTAVQCKGSGWMREELKSVHGNPFPIEVALLELDLPGVMAEIEILFFETAVMPIEGFEIFGEKLTFKCPDTLVRLVNPLGYFSKEVVAEQVDDSRMLKSLSLPEPLKTLCQESPLEFCGLVHEFVRSIVEDREPELGIARSFDINAPGIYAHASAMEDGKRIEVPSYEEFAIQDKYE